MDIEFRGNGMRDNPSVGTCDEYGVSGITSFDDLTEARRNCSGLMIPDTHLGENIARYRGV
ncbi:hypothetical protein [Pseudomonas syringae]|uniref:hypothetical protein n=1 Tax=Pseudomonas syringae TaxID=317 RepID=UPI001F1CFE44|nr:hypothetical protein [Pseudomonas syringae]MCF5226310.1 hypothetical protein [Pseudomonas syringae]MCF5245571.1 hypothetical protein [Pseudomonas syringae]